MSKINKTWLCVLVLTGGLLATVQTVQAASAEKQLQKGIEAYKKNNTDKAMDYFVDVLMTGDSEQAATASKYIEAIHNRVGGIKTPVEVNVSFPNQPIETIVDKNENLANYGIEKLDTLATEGESVSKPIEEAANIPKTLTEQIEERQLAGYRPGEGGPLNPQTSEALDQAAVLNEAITNGKDATQKDLQAISNEYNQEVAAEKGSSAAGTAAGSSQSGVAAGSQQALTVSSLSSDSSSFEDLTSPAAIEARRVYTTQKLQSLTDAAVAELAADKGVHLYLRPDGRPDAIDIDEGVLFKNNTFRKESLHTLNNIYELLALTQGARYVILPAGSYTDDVTLTNIRQAMALKSYFIKRGISQGKLYYNMGLVDQEVPTQFSNLKGLSIFFDYDAKLPTRLLENEEDATAPLLSMAIVPQCHAIDRSLGEAYAIDFSVLETVNTLDNWILQIVEHGRDGKYYIVRQLEGFAPVYHQILWNGRKGILGPELPCGKYTIVLTGIDLKGNKQTLRRRVVVKCAGDPTPNCQKGSCDSSGKLDYTAARLWKKPARRTFECLSLTDTEVVDAAVDVSVAQQATAASTSDNSYTVTKTVRNVVTTDTSSASGVSASSEGYAPAANNPYDVPYEEEYTATTTTY